MLDVVTSSLEVTVVALLVGALLVAAVILGHPWGWPVSMLAAAGALSAVRAALHARERVDR